MPLSPYRRPADSTTRQLSAIATTILLLLNSFSFIAVPSAFAQKKIAAAKTTSQTAEALSPSAPFASSNVVVYRVGTGTGTLTSAATPVFLDEYSPTGTLVQSIALPTTATGSGNRALTANGTSSLEGLMTRSADGQYLIVPGYNATTGAATPSGATAATNNRVIGRVDASGTIDTTTSLSDAFSGGNIRSAASTDGNALWGDGSNEGVRTTTLGSTTSTVVSTTVTNLRQINIFDGQLYISTGSGTAVRIGKVGTGTPTGTGQTITTLPGLPTSGGSPNAFFFADLDAGVAGVDTLYIADDGAGIGIQKYSLVGGTWTAKGTITATAVRGLTGVVSGTTVTLYGTTGGTTGTGGGSLYKFTDSTGYNATVSGTATTIATASGTSAFRGVALAPVGAATPTPTPSPTPTPTPSLSINDVTQVEGDSGQTAFNFTVSLSQAAGVGGVSFNYSTADGTATLADNDYIQVSGGSGSISQGNTSTTVTVQVNGDTNIESNETFLVNISNVLGAGVTDGQGQGTITNDDATLTGICAIQGSGSTSPVVGQSVTTRGIVTGTKAGSSGGYYIQDDACDANPNTSNGIFVFTGSTLPASAVVGNRVQVSGTIQEFIPSADLNQKPLTEFTSGSTVITLSTGNPVPNPVTITAAETQVNNLDNLEKYEGMRVQVPSLTVVGSTQGSITEPSETVSSTGVFFGVVTGVARPFREAGINASDPLPAGAPGTVPRFDENPERIRVDSDGQPGTTALDVAAGTVITNLIGELDYSFRAYTVLPEPSNPPTVGPQPGSVAAPTPTANELTVASFNMERFFDTVDDADVNPTLTSPVHDPIIQAAAYARRVAKASLIIRTVQRYPDVIGVEEVEHQSTLQDVANKINSDAVTMDGLPNPQYVAFSKEGNDVGGIDVGFLIKTSKVTVVGGDVTQLELATCDHIDATKCYNYTSPTNGATEILNDRPPLVLEATAPLQGGGTFAFTVIVNHLRSLSSIDDETVSGSSTAGGRVREKRRKQAEFLANYIQSRQTANPNEKIITLGDMNAFRVNDGYVDVIGTILGTPAPASQVTLASPDLVNPDQTDLVDTLPATQQYSYNFDGNAQTLDHIIVNPNALASITRFTYARDDSDFPVKNYESTNELRISDHDQPIAYFSLASTTTPPVCPTNVAAASYGATATASSEAGAGYAASGAIDGNHTGAGWGTGVGWNDATAGAYPDNLTVNLGITQQISEIDVYSLQDNYTSPIEPTDTTPFTQYGLTDFQVQVPDGMGGWQDVPNGHITNNNLVRRRITFGSPVSTDKLRVVVNSSADGVYSRIVEVEAYSCSAQVVPTPSPTPTPVACTTNVAAASYGATASASSEAGAGYAASGAIDGNHTGNGWGTGVGWNDGTAGAYPDNLIINLGVTQSISEVDVYSLQDNYNSPVEPTDTTTFSSYGLTDFQVQIPDGMGGWQDVPGGHVTGNNKVKRKVIFNTPVSTNQIRVQVNASADGVYSRVVEVEAFSCNAQVVPTPSPTPAPVACNTNVAASSYGTSATASSEFGPGYAASGAIDGNHTGNGWGTGVGWNDGTPFTYPDSLTIDLVVTQTINEIDVYSLQDNYTSPVEPTDTMTFNYYGLVDFQVQKPDGSGGWVDVPGGHAVLNNLVKRKFVFATPISTDKIRILVNNSSDAMFSRIVEVEAFSCNPQPTRCVNPGGTGGCSSTIQGAIDAAPPNVPITVFPGTYDEDVNVNKNGIRLLGADAATTNIRGPIGGPTSTVAVSASNVTIAGFTITRLGNNTTDWNGALNMAGISISGASTGTLVRDNIITGNRSGIDVNNSSGHTIRNNVIDFNRTGLIFRNQTDNETVVENFITNNWTDGVLFLDASGGTNSPVQTALHSTFSNNNISGNWYGQIVDRQTGGSLPAPGTTNLKNFRGNWLGTTSPVITTADSAEPGYADPGDGSRIPVAYGGTATPPGGQPDVAGPASANLKIDPILLSGTDTNVETTPGWGTFGFQGNQNTLVSPANTRNWGFFDDFGSGTGSGNFETGEGTPPLGSGSAFLMVDSTARYAFGVFTHYAGTRMDDITSLRYSSYQNNNTNTVLAISLQFDIDYNLNDANNAFQGRLVFEPYQSGTVQQNVWQTWDAKAGLWYASKTDAGGSNGLCPQNAPCTWQQVLAAFPNAGIRNTVGSALLFKAGGPWSPGFDGNVDAFKVGIGSFRTTYDFEPAP